MPEENEGLSRKLFAVRVTAFRQAITTNLFKTLLLIVGSAAAIGLLIYVLNYSVPQIPVREPFDNKAAYAKIAELEKELQVLKSQIAAVKSTNGFVATAQSAMKSAITYWALLAFLFAVGVGVYV